MNANHINKFETLVQRLVEGTFARLFAGRLRPLEVANALAHALEDHAVVRSGELPLAPDRYWVALHPADHDALLASQPNLGDILANHLFDLAQQAGFAMPTPPTVDLTPDVAVPLHRVQVRTRQQVADGEREDAALDSTRQMALPVDAPPSPDRPFLILEGRRHISLAKATISLGRSLDNDIIVDDARVSRRHAQLRRRYGRYVIHDLGSTGGTTVNGYPVQECVLEAGDVISLAGVELIYGEDSPSATPLEPGTRSTPALPQTRDLPALPPDRSET